MEATHLFVRMKETDDVATALVRLTKGQVMSDPEDGLSVTLRQDIDFGHKFATRAVPKGGLVHKYGQIIGVATQDIAPGEHVHVHNVASRRGRGDLKGASS